MVLWTPQHAKTLIPALIAMLIAALVMRKLLLKMDWRRRMIPFQIIAGLLILLEIGKQAYSFSRGYDLYHIPLHYCSLFLFSVPAMAFYHGKYRQAVQAVASAFCASLFIFMLVYPDLIYGAWDIDNYQSNFLSFHTVTFHNLVMFAFVLILALDLAEPPQKTDCKVIVCATGVFCVVAATMAQLLKTNYASFYNCNIPPLEAVRIGLQPVLGYALSQLLFVLIVAILTVAFTVGAYWVYRLMRKLTVPKPVKV